MTHLYLEVGHHYKRTYDDGGWCVFHVIDNDNLHVRVNVIKHSDGGTPHRTYISRSFPESKTVELTESEILAITL